MTVTFPAGRIPHTHTHAITVVPIRLSNIEGNIDRPFYTPIFMIKSSGIQILKCLGQNNTKCGEYEVMRIRSVENTKLWEYEVLRIRSVENTKCWQYEVLTIRSPDNTKPWDTKPRDTKSWQYEVLTIRSPEIRSPEIRSPANTKSCDTKPRVHTDGTPALVRPSRARAGARVERGSHERGATVEPHTWIRSIIHGPLHSIASLFA